MTDKTITFRVNGTQVASDVPGDTPLMHVLRNDLGIKGTRAGCGVGSCGSCMVLMDGRAVNSCDTPLWSVDGRQVTTVEGLGTPAAPHPVQRAFVELQAAQCGYCINGLMMSVAALALQPEPATEAALQAALTRHLCRCGTHLRIVQAARRALGIPHHG
jgi:aerobic-type carbon monoxide dehydrogenase small subunit (CoxS/CutS family)